jgi:hypothetical protein
LLCAKLLLDGDALAHGKAFFQLGATRHSPDHRCARRFDQRLMRPARLAAPYDLENT